jgi:dTDP-L-rhamnose 4-epimerase
MAKRVLITGGAGFIGSHVADELLRHGYEVRALDALLPQVHGGENSRPAYLDPEVELIVGDVRDVNAVRGALKGVSAVVHLAAKVGVGQSMYELTDYTSTNNQGTACLLEALVKRRVEKLIVASSMSIYGEGMYQDSQGRLVAGTERPLLQLRTRNWELQTPEGEILSPVPTPETKPPSLASIYALSKFDQERMCLLAGRAYGIPTVALRFFNVYGTRQALSNPYTGVLATFASRLLNNHRPVVFEDGYQQRDFVSVRDVSQACRLSLETSQAADGVFNIGSGSHFTIREVAACMAKALGKEHTEPEITDKYRVGDIRHCFADITLAQLILGYWPRVKCEDGLAELAEWLQGQIAIDRVYEASADLDLRGVTA